MSNSNLTADLNGQKPRHVLRVALAVPLRALFDYLPPENCDLAELQAGKRLLVPFGKSERVGLLTGVYENSEVAAQLLKPAIRLLDEQNWFRPVDLQLMSWAAAYYQHPTGEVMMTALPTHLRKGEEPVPMLQEAFEVIDDRQAEQLGSRAVRQQQVFRYLKDAETPVLRSELNVRFDNPAAAIRTLLDKGFISTKQIEMVSATNLPPQPGPPLNEQQQAAVDGVINRDDFHVTLLHGITGSGKTEVYLAIANAMLKAGRQVMILVPEIALTPQLLERFQQRTAASMVVLHSGLTDRQRSLAWQQAARGLVQVVVGTRSAVFTPMPKLGMIIVDEEHDGSFKQQEGFRYSARDMAVARAQKINCGIVLGSATPAFETLYNVQRKAYRTAKLTQRAGGARLPKMELIDIRSVRLEAGMSPVTRRLIAEELQQGNQVMVFLNRRGYAPVLSCHDCGWVGQCHRCDANLTVHAGRRRMVCHHCGYQQPVPNQCPSCESEKLIQLGQGTERVESTLQSWFADTPCVRIDYDTTRRKGSLQEKLAEVHSGEKKLLIGTQMLAKGHDFPGVTLVVMLDIDHGLFGTDFRAAERMAQQLMQVAGRAGRAERSGRVLIQTHHPEHPLLQVLIHQGYDAFAAIAMQERQQAGFPPYSYQALIRAEANQANLPENFLQEARELARNMESSAIEFWGPVSAVMQRKAGQHRFHLLLQTASRRYLHDFLDSWLEAVSQLPLAKKVRWNIDIDPQDFYS